jgi:hypothetical protein
MTRDNYPTIAAIALCAYLSADVAHHVMGHAAACMALGGQIKFLSSVLVICSATGSAIDLAGPFANLLTGIVAFSILHTTRHTSSATHLFLALVVAFNLFWFFLQLAFSVTTSTDDWAWFIKQFHISHLIRYAMIAAGIAGYLFTIHIVAKQMAPFASSHTRAKPIVVIAWITAGIIAVATAALDPNAAVVILRNALPQSMVLSAGLLVVSSKAARTPSIDVEKPLAFSARWIAIALLSGIASILLLGPGVALTT